jgi:hypothetical protein
MARKPKEIKRPVGVTPKEIDWEIVDEYLIAGCPGSKIADVLGIHPDTLYHRCEQEKGANFSAYAQKKKSKGDFILQKVQFDKAIGASDKGDNTLLIWLGKVRLEQRETQQIAVSAETSKNFESVMNQLDELQKTRHTSSSMNSPEE